MRTSAGLVGRSATASTGDGWRPAAIQRVTRRFRQRLLERVIDGGAHAEVARDERTTRYQVARTFAERAVDLEVALAHQAPRRLSLDEAHHGLGQELATVVSDLDRQRVIEVLDLGCQRSVIERWLTALLAEVSAGIEVARSTPRRPTARRTMPRSLEARVVCDRFHLIRGANTALDSVRRERQREARARRPRGTRRSGQHVTWRPSSTASGTGC
jgi:transposase